MSVSLPDEFPQKSLSSGTLCKIHTASLHPVISKPIIRREDAVSDLSIENTVRVGFATQGSGVDTIEGSKI